MFTSMPRVCVVIRKMVAICRGVRRRVADPATATTQRLAFYTHSEQRPRIAFCSGRFLPGYDGIYSNNGIAPESDLAICTC